MILPPPRAPFGWSTLVGADVLTCDALAPHAHHFFTTRAWSPGSRDPGRADVWADVATAAGVDRASLVHLRQVHGAAVTIRRRGVTVEATPIASAPGSDLSVSDDPSLALVIQTADCVPILLVDPDSGAVGAAHAGWRGLARQVPEVAVAAMVASFGSAPSRLMAAVGPSVSDCCYEVGLDVRDAFAAAGYAETDLAEWFVGAPRLRPGNPAMAGLSLERRAGHFFFDGWKVARHQLEAAGLATANVHVAELCTASHPDTFCSYRRDGAPAGRLAAVIRARG